MPHRHRVLNGNLKCNQMSSNEVVNMSPAQPEKYSATCWACNLELILPSYSPIFKCGYCGAITQGAGSHAFDYLERDGKHNERYLKIRDLIIVMVVILLILFIIVGGVWAIFPVLFKETNSSFIMHSVFTVILSFNVFFNYFCATFSHAGKPKHLVWGSIDVVKPNSLDNVAYCDKCRKPKPPSAHHCRACHECIMDMDHHCPFIGNCVGGNNQRHFVLFLFYTIFSCLYVCIMCFCAIVKLWPSISPLLNGNFAFAIATTTNLFWFTHFFSNFKLPFSMRMALIGYLVVLSITTTIAVGILFYQQISLILEGQTYIDSIQSSQHRRQRGLGRDTFGGKSVMGRLRPVFGYGFPLFWLLPLWNHPSGSRAYMLFSQKHRLQD